MSRLRRGISASPVTTSLVTFLFGDKKVTSIRDLEKNDNLQFEDLSAAPFIGKGAILLFWRILFMFYLFLCTILLDIPKRQM